MTLTLELARFVSEVREAPESARRAAMRSTLDLVGCAMAGAQTPGGRAACMAVDRTWGSGPARVWFSEARLATAGAAFANSAMGAMLDLDDGNRPAAGHPGAAMVPAVLALAEALGVDGKCALTAITIGYEVGVRIAASRDMTAVRTTDTGLWCGYGVAAAAAWLRGLSPEATAHALAIAGGAAPRQAAAGFGRIGNHQKESIPWATATALAAVDLAGAGFTGPLDVLDNPARYDAAWILDGLGEGPWRVEQGYFKLYSCCRWAHAAIEAVLDVRGESAPSPEDIESIEVSTFGRALTLSNAVRPDNLEAAQYSVPFCVALALVHGAPALLPLKERHLADPRVLALSQRVRLMVDGEFDAMFPAAVPAQVVVRTPRGALTRRVMAPHGEASHPLSDDELEEKFDALAAPRLPSGAVAPLKAAIWSLDGGALSPLLDALAVPLRAGDAQGLSSTVAPGDRPQSDSRVRHG